MRRALAVLAVWATALLERVRERVTRGRQAWRERPEGGYTTEVVAVTALLIAAAILVVGVIVAKVTAKAHSIDLGP
jgi:ABC-type Fe3+ transport system permease subunit